MKDSSNLLVYGKGRRTRESYRLGPLMSPGELDDPETFKLKTSQTFVWTNQTQTDILDIWEYSMYFVFTHASTVAPVIIVYYWSGAIHGHPYS